MEVNTQIQNADDEMEIDLKELFFVFLSVGGSFFWQESFVQEQQEYIQKLW